MGEIVAVCSSVQKEKGEDMETGILLKERGLGEGGEAGSPRRLVSLLAVESIEQICTKDLKMEPGDGGENLTTRGIDLLRLPPGTRLQVGAEAILRITPSAAEYRELSRESGGRILPQEGVFAEVLKQGPVRPGDGVIILPQYRFGIITVSDKGAAGEREDKSGPLLGELLLPLGEIACRTIVPDEHAVLAAELRRMVAQGLNAVFTSGGTGLSPRDITPEATLEVVERVVPGIAEAMRRETFSATPRAMLSRAAAGICGQTLIINLPGSPKAVRECFAVLDPILDHALETLAGRGGDCGAEK